jgi:predicted dehydrogenase
MTENKLRVGIIGAGFYAAMTHIPQLRATGRAEVVAIARRNPERLALVQRELSVPEAYTDWREMLDKSQLDAVVVCTPHNQHVEPTLAALQRGQHVLLEKPVTDTIEGAQALVRAAESASCVLTVGEDVRGMRSWRAVKRALETGAVGSLKQISVACCLDGFSGRENFNLSEGMRNYLAASPLQAALGGDFLAASSWRNDPKQMGGDSFFDIGVHLVDLLLWLAGAPAQQVVGMQAQGDAPGSAILTVQARLTNGVLLSVTYNDRVSGPEWGGSEGLGQLTAYGSTGWLSADWGGGMKAEAEHAYLGGVGPRQTIDFAAEGETVNPAAAFVATVLDGAPNLCSIQAGAEVVSLIQSAYRSAAESQVVTLS